jgi:hypothetical protein
VLTKKPPRGGFFALGACFGYLRTLKVPENSLDLKLIFLQKAMMTYQLPPQRLFIWTLGLTLLLKLFLAVWFPLTGDEAFFYQWGQSPALGYADHPPMVGWWLAALSFFSDHIWVGRLAPVLLTVFIALGIVDILGRLLPTEYRSNAWWMGAIYLVMPWSWMLVLVTTDTPLIFFMTFAAWLFVRAETSKSSTHACFWYAATGAALGLAFLSKYFAVLLGAAFAVYLLGWRRDRWWALLAIVGFALPSIALHLYFNLYHGWQNVMFNIFNRHENSDWNLQTILVYLLMTTYLFTPWLLYQSIKTSKVVGKNIRILILLLFLVPLFVLLLISAKRTVGLHWILGFVPLFIVWSGFSCFGTKQLSRFFNWTLLLSIPHLIGLWVLVGSPLHWWENSNQYNKIVFLRDASQVTQILTADMPGNSHLMTTSYSPAAILAYHHKRYVPVFGVGRHYARQDDLVVDFRELDGQSIRIFNRSPIDVAEFAPFFKDTQVHTFQVSGVSFYWMDGKEFNYLEYRDKVLTNVASQFHDIPKWMPVLGNPFCDRYAFVECAPVVRSEVGRSD